MQGRLYVAVAVRYLLRHASTSRALSYHSHLGPRNLERPVCSALLPTSLQASRMPFLTRYPLSLDLHVVGHSLQARREIVLPFSCSSGVSVAVYDPLLSDLSLPLLSAILLTAVSLHPLLLAGYTRFSRTLRIQSMNDRRPAGIHDSDAPNEWQSPSLPR